ncbi:MAG: hypothetical protein ACYCYN_12530, partial [Solirubrobacteraceae bacterium]
GTPVAFAGWSATPTPPHSGQQAAAEAKCQLFVSREGRTLARLLVQRESRSGSASHKRRPRVTSGARLRWRPLAGDTRGPYTLLVLGAGSRRETCLVGPAGSGRRQVAQVVLGTSQRQAPPANGISEARGGLEVFGRHRGALSYALGRAGANVTGVTIELHGGQHVLATTSKGWFLAWWPSARTPLAAEIATRAGVHVQRPLYPR